MAQKFEIDTDWFREKLDFKGSGVRALARHLKLDAGAMSRTLTGDRRMQRNEAVAIAHFIGAPISEVFKHARIKTVEGEFTPVLLIATVDEVGQVEPIAEPRPLPHSVVEQAQSAIGPGTRALAAQIRAPSGPLAVLDDAVVLFSHTEEVEPSAIGVLSICRNFAGEQMLARIEKARKTGEIRVVTVDGKVKEFDLQTATPVLTIIP